MTQIKCPKCGRYGKIEDWKDGHGNKGELRMVYHRKKWNDATPNRCYIDPITSAGIKAELGREQQQQQKLL